MMKSLTFVALGILLTACARPDIIETPLARNQIYYGQTVGTCVIILGLPKKRLSTPMVLLNIHLVLKIFLLNVGINASFIVIYGFMLETIGL